MHNPLTLAGRRILVTGASSGIGRAASVVLHRLGANLILVGRDEERLSGTKALLEDERPRIACFDLAQTDRIADWMKGLAESEGPLDGLVHCAGLHATWPLRVLDPPKLDQILSVNVAAAIQLARGFRQRSVRAASGSIVFLASVMGIVGQPGAGAYAASKGALIASVRSLALELASEKIRINCIAPSMVRTEMMENLQRTVTAEQFARIEAMHPLGFGEPADVAYAIAFLLADTARWITGTTLVVDGGYTAH